MPESKGRNVPSGRPADAKQKAAPAGPSPRWYAPVMVGLFIFGLLWIVVWYLAGDKLPVVKDLGNWNMAVGFAFILGGFFMSTKWR